MQEKQSNRPSEINFISDAHMQWRKECDQLDVIASSNGCRVVDYKLAANQRNKGLVSEFVKAVVYFGCGLAIGTIVFAAKVLIVAK